MKSRSAVLAVAILVAGCASDPGINVARRENLFDASGAVVGYQEFRTGE